MGDKELNIKSSTIEKALELAKEFLGKLISPTVEEIGLLLSDNIKFYRFKNQVRILLKAKEYVEKHKIKVKEIPTKILVPLLENASLEDDENLQDKWAKMLTNMVDSDNNLQNQIFPHILSQISIEEFNELKAVLIKEQEYLRLQNEFGKHNVNSEFYLNRNQVARQLWEQIQVIQQSGFSLQIKEYEIANLTRLGLIRQLPPKIYIEEFKTGEMSKWETPKETWHRVEAEYDVYDYGYRLTELGSKFLDICEVDENEN